MSVPGVYKKNCKLSTFLFYFQVSLRTALTFQSSLNIKSTPFYIVQCSATLVSVIFCNETVLVARFIVGSHLVAMYACSEARACRAASHTYNHCLDIRATPVPVWQYRSRIKHCRASACFLKTSVRPLHIAFTNASTYNHDLESSVLYSSLPKLVALWPHPTVALLVYIHSFNLVQVLVLLLTMLTSHATCTV